MRLTRILIAFALSTTASPKLAAQWQMQDPHVTADLRGIDYVGNGVAWASGTNGTVLRTEDLGFVWQLCTIPPGAEKLDFRGIQAFDNNTAIVMSSGKGDLSRLYKTTDGCQTWRLVFSNPDPDGFWDAFVSITKSTPIVLGGPVAGSFPFFCNAETALRLERCRKFPEPGAQTDEAAFAASNSALEFDGSGLCFVTGGSVAESLCLGSNEGSGRQAHWIRAKLPLATATSAGAFSLASNNSKQKVVVGGDYAKPDSTQGNAAWSSDFGEHWAAANTSPHGYRSAVAFDQKTNTWITVGPNGTDLSTDDGRNWRPLKPGPEDAPDADQHWNALSLPFVVGPHGRIGILRNDALTAPAASHAK